MATNKPPNIVLQDLRGSRMPSGYLLGRASQGTGAVELLTQAQAKAVGLLPVTLPPSGAAGGDLSGTYPNPTVSGLQGRTVSSSAPGNLDVLAWSTGGNAWAPLHLGAAAYTNSYLDLSNLPPLTGGALGQVLTKNSSTNYDFSWQNAGGAGGSPSSFWLNTTDGFVALVDSNAQLVLDGAGNGVYVKDPVLPASMIPVETAPTYQVFTTIGAITWNRPAGCTRIEVYMEAPGGGSAGVASSGATAGGDASDAIFNSIHAAGGKGGKTSGAGGAGGKSGTGSAGSGEFIERYAGVDGGFAIMLVWTSTNFIIVGGQGGNGPSPAGGGSGAAGVAGTDFGQGAAGACLANATQATLAGKSFAGGGGQGERVFYSISNPASSYSGTIADGGAAGTGADFAGAKGAPSRIVVKEFYS